MVWQLGTRLPCSLQTRTITHSKELVRIKCAARAEDQSAHPYVVEEVTGQHFDEGTSTGKKPKWLLIHLFLARESETSLSRQSIFGDRVSQTFLLVASQTDVQARGDFCCW